VPGSIGADWLEAYNCLGIQAYKAAAAMARRATQGICIDKEAKPDKLVNQVKALVASGSLHPNLGKWADRVRILGNAGAHPGDDGLEQVTEQDAKDAVAFLDQLLEWTYVAPWRLEQSKAQNQP
jgi:hypothetical protein